MQIEIDTVKGFQDFLPPTSLKRSAVKKIVEKYFKLYGFIPIETPVIEFDELMKSDNLPADQEDEAISDRFRLKDRGGRNLGLRYEFTFQLARIFRQNPTIKLPFRRYQIGEIFRDEPIGAGRFRQFTQCDADLIGDSSIEGETEVFAMLNDILKELKIDAEFVINNRILITSIIESVQITEKNGVMKELDKIDKLGEDVIKSNLRKYADGNQIMTLFKLLQKPLEFFMENKFEGAEQLTKLAQLSKKYSLSIKFSPNLMRGFSYYTGNVFEVRSKNCPGSIAGGGRYDKSVGKYLNREIPAFGFGMGLERLCELAKVELENVPKALLISIDQESESIKLIKKLRKESIACVKTSDKIGKAMEYANSYNIPFVIFIGADEVEKQKFKLKNMISGDEKFLTELQLIKALK
jgi:histidyl-tRNA synthetase